MNGTGKEVGERDKMTRKLYIGIVLVALLLLVGTVDAYPRAVLFTFDDSRASVYYVGYPIFESHGYKATFYVVTDQINEGSYVGKSTINRSQLKTLYDAGWDIADHTRSHPFFLRDKSNLSDNMNLAEQIAEIQGGKDNLTAWGFTRASSHISYPGGQYDDNTTLAMASCGMLTGRTVESAPQTVPPFNNDLFHLTGVRPLTLDNENEQYAYLESLSSDNVVIYLTHGVDDLGAGASNTTNVTLKNMLNYMDDHNIPVWTITELYANISASGTASPVASFTGTPVSGTAPLTVAFTDTSTNSPTSWAWRFGDGGTSTLRNPSHTYTTAGTYMVTLIATNAAGNNSNPGTGYITVISEATPPVASGIVIFRPASGYWYFDNNLDGTTDNSFRFGSIADQNITGDWNGDGSDGIAIFRPANGYWYFDNNLDGIADNSFRFGGGTDRIISGDWNGDGSDGIAIFRPANGYWYFDNNLDGIVDNSFRYGGSADQIIRGDWNGDGSDGIAIFRPATGYWYFDYNLDGKVDNSFRFGGFTDRISTVRWA